MKTGDRRKNRKKLWIVKGTVLLAVLLLTCTVMARTVENLLLPKVETVSVYGGSLTDKAQIDGNVICRERISIWSLGEWKILDVYTEEGQMVEKEAPLLKVDTSPMELAVQEIELEREKLRHERNTAGTRWSRIQEIDAERHLLDEKIEALRKQYPQDGVVRAPQAGTVQMLAVQSQSVTAEGNKLIELLPSDSPKTIQWEMSEEAWQRFSGMDKIQLYFIAEREGERSYQSEEITVENQIYDSERGTWKVSGELSDLWNSCEISKVQVLLKYESLSYPLIIPAECVTERNGQYFVYAADTREGVFGDESIVREIEISVLEKNSRQVAAESGGIREGQKLVRYADKALKDQETVNVVVE